MPDAPKNPAAAESQATIVFVLGLLGLITCQVLGPFAWYMGNQYLEACRAEGIQPHSMGVAGRVLGIVGTALLIVLLVILLLYVLFFVCYFGFVIVFMVLFIVAAALGAH